MLALRVVASLALCRASSRSALASLVALVACASFLHARPLGRGEEGGQVARESQFSRPAGIEDKTVLDSLFPLTLIVSESH